MHRCKRSSRGGTQHPARPLARWHGSRDIDLLASAHINLEIFDGARSTLKEALNFTHRCDDKESAQVASCHQNMAFICQQQVFAIKAQVGMHMNYMLTNSMVVYHSQVSRVLVEGLQKNQQYNGIEGVVMIRTAHACASAWIHTTTRSSCSSQRMCARSFPRP